MSRRLATLVFVPLAVVACAESRDTATGVETPPEAAAEASDSSLAHPPRSASAEGARVFFISPADGDVVTNPVRIVFGIEGMSVVPAGEQVPHSGHHHLLIDTGLPEPGLPIPSDGHHIHFGDASTETEMTLEPGEHTLQMLLGDHLHIPHDPPLASGRITIVVE